MQASGRHPSSTTGKAAGKAATPLRWSAPGRQGRSQAEAIKESGERGTGNPVASPSPPHLGDVSWRHHYRSSETSGRRQHGAQRTRPAIALWLCDEGDKSGTAPAVRPQPVRLEQPIVASNSTPRTPKWMEQPARKQMKGPAQLVAIRG